jgi:hypothetical protein
MDILPDKFCRSCETFRRGTSKQTSGEDYNRMRYVHHDTSVSFQQAIEMNCAICVRLSAALEHGDAANLASMPAFKSFVAGPTTYEKAPIGSDDNSAVIHFRCRDLFARLVLELWSGQ